MYFADVVYFYFFFFNDTATTEIYTLSLHDALPICRGRHLRLLPHHVDRHQRDLGLQPHRRDGALRRAPPLVRKGQPRDRKSTRLNSSHANISYAVFCLKKKNIKNKITISTI